MKTRTCLAPECGKKFTPRLNVPSQVTCGRAACQKWYRSHWAATAGPPRAIPPEDWAKIEKALPKAPDWVRVVAILGRESGMRISEMLGLTVSDILEHGKVRGTIAIRGQWKDGAFAPPKTGASRPGFLTERAVAAVSVYLKGRRLEGTDRLLPYSRQYAWSKWVEFQHAAGVRPPDGKHYRTHDLRHTCGTNAARAGRLDLAQKLLGHRNPATTQRYNTPRNEEILADIEKIGRDRK